MKNRSRHHHAGKIRYAVVGLGHIAQNAILPAFAHAGANSVLTALVSDDPTKLRAMSQDYNVENLFSYDDFDVCLRSGEIDAVYIALPNNMHREYCVRAARAGIHVLCEKPLAPTEDDCQEMIQACAENGVNLMAAYRLHFERGNLEAMELVKSGKIGEPRIFNSVFCQQVKPGNTRVKGRYEQGPLYDVGIYCINASRYLFREEPTEVMGFCASGDDPRFRDVEEMASAVLRFPGDRLANFTCSFGAADVADYEVVGTRGRLRAVHGYEYSQPITLELTVDGRTQKRTYEVRDQFAPEIIYFSDCVLRDKEPEPSGIEGLLDVHIIRSLYESAKEGRPVRLKELTRRHRPTMRQNIYRHRGVKPPLVHVKAPSA